MSKTTKRNFSNNRFTFTGVFVEFKEKRNGYGEMILGFVMKDITNFKTKKRFSKEQWFNLGEGFKEAFEKYSDEELPGKTIKFNGFKSMHKKGTLGFAKKGIFMLCSYRHG